MILAKKGGGGGKLIVSLKIDSRSSEWKEFALFKSLRIRNR